MVGEVRNASVNIASFDSVAKTENSRSLGSFSHSQLGAGKIVSNPSLFVDAGDIQDALEGGSNLKKMMSTSKKDEEDGNDVLEALNKKLEELQKAQESGASNLDPEKLGDILQEFQSLDEKGELNEDAIKRALGGMSGQDQYEALGLIIETLKETDSEKLANALANTPVIDHNSRSTTFSEMRNGLAGSMSRVADFTTLGEAISYINEEMNTDGESGFYKTVSEGIDWLRAGLVIEMAMCEGAGIVGRSD
ncbi:MAG: hypothetical protein KAG53_05770 [Endozoicomonadaceae bacterium]|nr:hypothetical protein [Endozoicomonadaceae bacterium]